MSSEKCCLRCGHFTLWDNDWCCVWKFKILSEIKNNKTSTPELCENITDCEEFESDTVSQTQKFIKEKLETWNKMK